MATIKKRSDLETRAIEIHRRAGALVDFVGVVRLPRDPVLIDGHGGTDWLVLDSRIDPTVAKAQLGIPAGARRQLARIAATGVDFDAFFIGHELPPGTAKQLAEIAPDGPTDLRAVGGLLEAKARDRRAEKLVAATNKTVAAASGVARRAGRAAAGVASALGSALDGLDPVIFGAVTADGQARPGDLAAWFHLVHWT